jgi:ketosteroid isomerase-like protein
MAVTADQGVIERYYRAMEAGSTDQMNGIFTDDAVYREPFSKGGELTTHAGKPEIVGWLGASFEQGNKGVTITLDRLDVDGDTVVAEWTCRPGAAWPEKRHDRPPRPRRPNRRARNAPGPRPLTVTRTLMPPPPSATSRSSRPGRDD